ncbi:MAG: SBBP repeat-containing protein [Gammaproteobacteria bacterium]
MNSRSTDKSISLRLVVLVLTMFLGIIAIIGSNGGGGDGGGGSAPIIDDITLFDNDAAAGLEVSINGELTFTDADGDLDGGSFNYNYAGMEVSITLPSDLNGITAATVQFTMLAQLNDTVGEIIIPCWLLDSAGNRSNTFEITFNQVWTRQYGTVVADTGNAITRDINDNVIVTGSTMGDLDDEINHGGQDIFVTKFSPGAIKQWTKVFGSADDDIATGVAADNNANIYVTGYTNGTTFDGETAPGGIEGVADIFITKFDSSGNRVWTRLIGTPESDISNGIVIDPSDVIYIAGETTGDLYGTSAGSSDVFVVAYNSNASEPPLWSEQFGSSGSDFAKSIALDSADGVFVAGGTEGVLGGEDPTPGDPVINFDAFVARYNLSGVRSWTRQIGTSCNEWAEGVAGKGGNAYLTGAIYTCAIGSEPALGLYDAFLAGIDSSGIVQFTGQFGTGNHDRGLAVEIDSFNNIYIAGFIDSPYQTEGGDIMLYKFDSQGNHIWNITEGGPTNLADNAYAIMIDAINLVYLTGFTEGALDGHTNAGGGSADIFIMRYDSDSIKR